MTKQSSHCTFGPDFAVTDKNRESKEYGWWHCAVPFIFTTEFHSTPRLLKIKIKKRTKNLHVLLKPPMFQYSPGLHFTFTTARLRARNHTVMKVKWSRGIKAPPTLSQNQAQAHAPELFQLVTSV